MANVEHEFQTRDVAIIRLDTRLTEAKTIVSNLSQKLKDAEGTLHAKNNQIIELQSHFKSQYDQSKKDLNELKEFLHVENLSLMETLGDTELENDQLKEIIENKDEELSKCEEQCRHLVRLGEQRHQRRRLVVLYWNR
jgi:chromosome segregation ATPase